MIRLEALIELEYLNSSFSELILLSKLDKQFLVERFEATVSQSTVPSPPLKKQRAVNVRRDRVAVVRAAIVLHVFPSAGMPPSTQSDSCKRMSADTLHTHACAPVDAWMPDDKLKSWACYGYQYRWKQNAQHARKSDFIHHNHHPEGVVYRNFGLNSSTFAISEIASKRWWCIESLFPNAAPFRPWGQCLRCVTEMRCGRPCRCPGLCHFPSLAWSWPTTEAVPYYGTRILRKIAWWFRYGEKMYRCMQSIKMGERTLPDFWTRHTIEC